MQSKTNAITLKQEENTKAQKENYSRFLSKNKRALMQQSFPAVLNVSILDGNNGFIIPGIPTAGKSGRLGISVSTAGDVNGDGIGDLVLGAPFDSGQTFGAVYVIFGNRSGFPAAFNLTQLNGSNGFSISGIAATDSLGFSVSTVGDINGDNVTDLGVGALYANSGWGMVYVIFGSQSVFPPSFNLTQLNGSNGFTISGIVSNGNLAYPSTAGDINKDGINDLIVGANNGNGVSYVIFGSLNVFPASFNLTNLNGSNGFTVPGLLNSGLGYSPRAAGDVNNDGISDIIVGAQNTNSNLGATYVIFGNRAGFPVSFDLNSLNGSNGFTIPGIIPNGYLGHSVSTAGDINADGISDIVISADTAGLGLGASYVIFGSPNGFAPFFNLSDLNGTNGFSIADVEVRAQLGFSVNTAGDINGDGISDVVLGATGEFSATGLGKAYVIFGSRSNFPASFNLTQLDGSNGFTVLGGNHSFLGGSVSSAGDINGDGISDLVVGASGLNPNLGVSYVIFGKNTSFSKATPTPTPISVPTTNFTSVTILPNQQSVAVYAQTGYYYAQLLNTTNVAVSAPIQLTTTLPKVTALPNSDFILAYQNGTRYTVQEFNSNGTLINNLGLSDSSPIVTVLSNGNFVLTYQNSTNYYDQVFNANSTVIGGAFSLSNSSSQIIPVSTGNFVVLYQNATGSYTQVFNSNASIIGTPTFVAGSNSSVQTTLLSNGNFVVTYQNVTGNYTQFFNATGLSVGNAISLGLLTNVTALTNNNALFTYQNGTRYYSQVLNNLGNQIGNATTFVVPPITVALSNGNFVVTYQNGMNYNTQLFNASGASLGSEITAPSASTVTPLLNGGFILSYTKGSGSYAQVFDAQGNPVNPSLVFNALGLQLTTLTNRFVATYPQRETTYVELFDLQGISIGSRHQLAGELRSITGIGNNEFLVMYQNGLNYYTQRFDSSGSEVGYPAQLSGSSTLTNHPPVVLNVPSIQTVEVNQAFSFQLNTTEIFNDTDGDTLTFFAASQNNGSLPGWLHFEQTDTAQLNFSGVAPAAGNTRIQLLAKDPLNEVVSTSLDIFAQMPNAPETNLTTAISAGVVGGLVGLAGLAGGIFGFWRYASNRNSRSSEEFADAIRSALNLKQVSNFHSQTGQKFVSFAHGLESALKAAGIDISTMGPNELREFANDVADAARNKISPASDCLSHSVITVTDLNNNLQSLVTELQVLRSGGQGRGYAV